MSKHYIEIACRVVKESGNAIAVADGTEEESIDPRTGEVRLREKWFWLPKSLVEINDDGTISLPEWLAHDRGLI